MSKNVNKAKINVEFNEATTRENLVSGESINTLFGKIKKIITDLHDTAFTGYNEASNENSGLMSAADKSKLDAVLSVDDAAFEYANSKKGLEDAPVGHIISYMGNNAPKHYLICDGTIYNIADYPYLVQHFINQFGSSNYFGGDGTTTFAVPDLRGEFLRGTGTNSHDDQGAGAGVGTHQDATEIPNFYYDNKDNNFALMQKGETNSGVTGVRKPDSSILGNSGELRYIALNSKVTTDGISWYGVRPTNTSVLYCIKYEPTYYVNNTHEYNANNMYSTEEMVVGRWINGKPLYRCTCTIDGDDTTGAQIKYFTQIKNAEHVTIDFARSYLYNASTGETGALYNNQFNQTEGIGLTIIGEEARVKLIMSRQWWNMLSGYITFVYTKTTDSESSEPVNQDGCLVYTDEEVRQAVSDVLGG